MNIQKLTTAALAGFLVQAVLSFLFYEFLMAEQFAQWEAAVARDEPMMAIGMAGLLIFNSGLAAIYPKGYQGGDAVQEGARFGLLVAVVLAGLVLMFYSFYNFELAGSLTDIVFHFVVLPLVGITIAKVYGGAAAGS